MPQLIEGGLCGNQESGQVGPFYELTCPECGSDELEFGKTDDMAYGSEHHGENLNEIHVPIRCAACQRGFKLWLRPGAIGGIALFVTHGKKKR